MIPKIIKSIIFSNFSELVNGVSTKYYGSMKQTNIIDSSKVIHNQKKFYSDLSILPKKVVSTKLVHGNKVLKIKEKHNDGLLVEADGLITDIKNIFLTVTGADCPPVLFYDNTKDIVGIAHAGWRGLEKGLIQNMIDLFETDYFSNPEDIKVFVGPAIGVCHFEVQDDVVSKFLPEYKDFVKDKDGKKYIDLKNIIKNILLKKGLKNDNIEISEYCTFCCDDLFSSYRREKDLFQPMSAIIGMR